MTIAVAHSKSKRLSEEQSLLVRNELAAILASDSFSSSKRCRDFLEFVVERALAGDFDSLTERFLGVELFGRAVDYETATDSIVRVRANDVRRRLGQYYSSARSKSPARIDLIAGGYVPDFHWTAEEKLQAVSAFEQGGLDSRRGATNEWDKSVSLAAAVEEGQRDRKKTRLRVGSAVAAVVLAGLLLALFLHSRQSNSDRFWRPVVEASSAPVLSLPATDTFMLTLSAAQLQSRLAKGDTVNVGPGDLLTFHNWHESLPIIQATLSVALALERRGKIPLVRLGTDLSRDELRGHPLIAIGSFSNPWTKQNISGLRFTFDRGASDLEPPRIRDSSNPNRYWSLAQVYPQPQTKDYAIVTRTFDPVTHEPFISLAGLHSFGNQIAGEFVSQDSSWNDLAARAPKGWDKMNFQVLLETNVVGTTPGSPRIVDVYFWR